MLARLETLYLGILRVVILVIATLALLVAVLGAASALPQLLARLGLSSQPAIQGGTLGEFIMEMKATKSTGATSESPYSAPAIDPGLAAAAKALQRYTHGAGGLKVADWERLLTASADRVPVGRSAEYSASVVRLADQLSVSKGKPLTVEQVGELMAWHERKFIAAASDEDDKCLADTAKSSLTLYAAGAAFVLFILITFTFLFVKIERSLRVVRTRAVEEFHA